jgi:hypothetical protein
MSNSNIMKKILLLTAMLVTSYNLFAFTTQANWRWRNDDGTETSATWKANQNTPITLSSTGENFRLRIEVYNNNTDSVGLLDTLQYATSTSGPWTDISTVASSNAFQIAGASAFVTQNEPTTAQLTGVALTFVPGKIMVDSMVLKQNLPSKDRSEFEWTIKGTANLKPATTYYFREWGSTANSLDIGMTYPSLATADILPVTFANFTVAADKDRVVINWKTATEQNNSHFDIERSNDGLRFSTIATVEGSGTSSIAHTYTTYDNSPYNGVNYYRIKQYDIDGKFAVSSIRSINMLVQATGKVYPNPSHGDVNFTLQNNQSGSITAILTDLSGKIVHQEIIQTNTAASSYKLNLKTKLATGMYVLQLKGESVSESIKIAIQ